MKIKVITFNLFKGKENTYIVKNSMFLIKRYNLKKNNFVNRYVSYYITLYATRNNL